ncbi:MAG: nicotinate (nicotinamide) nucleotide adenylyltransferase [Chloroflexi bacterium]|nr:nicotinate (nicotinamide) nucleotide adenylyltransferase [Chloroflexota bacterium]
MAAVKHGVMGGTFDPVHIGHMKLAEHAQQELGLDDVLWITAGDPWRKGDRNITPARHRLAMVQLAIEVYPSWRASTAEIDRPGPTYTVDTLRELHARQDGDNFTLIVGQDALEDLPNWHEPTRLLELADLAVAVRGGRRLPPEELDSLVPGLSGRVTWLSMPPVPFSATQVRSLASSGAPLSGFVPKSVEAYIREHQLYRAG